MKYIKSFDVEKTRNDFPILKIKVNNKPLVYLDNAATTQKPRKVINTIKKFYETKNANIHRGLYSLSEQATNEYEQSHRVVAKFINASPEEISFTKNATESLNLLAYSLCSELNEGDEILLTQMEHHSNLVPWQQIAKQRKLKVKFAEINSDGTLNVESFRSMLSKKTKIVSATHASNFLGTINPVEELSKLAHDTGAIFIVDASQSVPHMPVDVKKIGADFLVFSGHKMLGPAGIGVLYGRKNLLEKMRPFLFGGGMIKQVSFEDSEWSDLPWKFEAGTPNIEGSAGLTAAVKYLNNIGMKNIQEYERELTEYALEKLKKIEGMTIYGPNADKKVGIVSFNLAGIHPHDIAAYLDEYGIAVRGGHHCAMPLAKVLNVQGTVRASFYFYNTKEEIDKLVEALKKAKEFFK
ncbi:MAG TPA: cysteine desulfurase [Candidatus Nanoarchaeia archaeon]|nr:cysteine desulfurase [Candidatus Nanoarchaeia archaeon]